MKQFVYIILIILFFFSCKRQDGYVIEGRISGLSSPLLYFVREGQPGELNVDTIQAGKDGRFSYSFAARSGSSVKVYMENGGVWATVWLGDKDKINIGGDAKYPEMIVAKGGEVNDLLSEFRLQNKSLLTEKRDLTDLHSSYIHQKDSINSSTRQLEFESKISNVDHQLRKKVEEFISENPSSIASLVLFQDYLLDMSNPDVIKENLQKLSGEALRNPMYDRLVEINQRLSQTLPGGVSPDFKVLDIDGDTIKLSSYKGKYFVLNFAASWCEMCEQENLELVGLYKDTDRQKLEILTISLDGDSAAWMDVVKSQKLNWRQVVDTHGWSSEMVKLYNVTEIPFNILIDKESIIVGRNLSADSIRTIIRN